LLGNGGPPWPIDAVMIAVGILAITFDNGRLRARLGPPPTGQGESPDDTLSAEPPAD
jgi:hypothetical protein